MQLTDAAAAIQRADRLLVRAHETLRAELMMALEGNATHQLQEDGKYIPLAETISDGDIQSLRNLTATIFDIETHFGGALAQGPSWLDAALDRARAMQGKKS